MYSISSIKITKGTKQLSVVAMISCKNTLSTKVSQSQHLKVSLVSRKLSNTFGVKRKKKQLGLAFKNSSVLNTSVSL